MPVLSSLIITIYNREGYLGAAIESVLAQTRGNFELLVWDDGSIDRSVEIAQDYARQDARVRVVTAQHQGRGRVLKDAIAQTTGSYIGIVDSDDILAVTALEETAAVLDAHPDTGLVYTDYLVMSESGEVTGYGSRCRYPYSPMGLLRKFMIFHFRLIRRTVYEQVGGINTSKDAQDCASSIGKRFTQSLAKTLSPFLAALPLLGAISVTPALAQIVPAADGTNTLVNTTGNQLDITGGQTSSNGTNLFHSFSQFDLNAGQTANFQSNPTIQNILGRVVSGNASNINGLIQVSGSQANLYLMNPAGIIFGSNASLNVPADFVATTATSIGIGDSWFNAAGTNNYTQLDGTPNAFAFTTPQPGSIVNSGNLTVGAQQNLLLLGGTVVNTGQLNAQAGKIIVAAVPGERLVRLSQPGMVLSLEVPLPASGSNSPSQWTLPVLSLPQLLTGGSGGNATGIAVNANGQAALTGSGVQIPNAPGTAIVSGTINASSSAPNQRGGEVNILGDRVGLVSANIDASGTNGGGTVLIGGDYQGKGTVPNASRTFVSSDSTINADALTQGDGGKVILWADKVTGFHGNISARGGSNSGNGGFVEVSGKQDLIFRGDVNVKASQGSLGTLLLDPTNITIVNGAGGADDAQLADGQILEGDGTGATFTISETALEALAAGANVILEATNDITINDLADNQLIFAAGPGGFIQFTADSDGDGVGNFSMNVGDTIRAESRNVTLSAGGNVTVGEISTFAATPGNNGGNISITTTGGSITASTLEARSNQDGNGGVITLNAADDITVSNSIFSLAVFGNGDGGAVTINSANGRVNLNRVNSGSENGVAGAISITAASDIVVDDVADFFLNADASGTGTGGNVAITSSGGNIVLPDGINASSTGGNGGSILLSALGNITTGNIDSTGQLGTGTITLNTTAGSIDTSAGALSSSGENAGAILLSALGNITTGSIDSTGLLGGGTITLNSTSGSINTSAGTLSSESGQGNAGAIALSALGDITTSDLFSSGGFVNGIGLSGDVTLTSTNGKINTSAGQIRTGGTSNNPGNLTLSASDDITLGGITSLAGINTRNITITSSNGTIFTSSPINVGFGGRTPNPGTVTLNAGVGGIVLGSDIDASNNGASLNFIGNVTLAQPTITLTTSGDIGSGNITFNNLLDGTTPGAQNLILNSGIGTVTFNGIGNSAPLGNLTINGTGNVQVAGNYIFPNGYTFDKPVNLIGNTTINTADTLAFSNTLAVGANNLTLNANEINLLGLVSGTGNLTLQPFTPSQAIAIGGATDSGTGTLDLTTTDLDAIGTGLTSLTIGRSDGSGAITLNPVTFDVPTIIQTSTAAGSITTTPGDIRTNGKSFTLISNQINTSASTIDTSIYFSRGGAISFTAPGGITLGNLIATGSSYYGNTLPGGDIAIVGPVTLANSSTNITTGISDGLGAGNIKFSSTINATTPGTQALNMTVGTGTVTFDAAVGGVTPLGGLSTTGGNGSQVFVKSDISIANNNLTFNQPVTLTGNATFKAETGTIGFNSSLATGNNALTLTANEIDFAGGANSVTGTGNLKLQPFTPSQNIAIAGSGDSGAATLDITTADIAALRNGFNSITIGGTDTSGTITIANPVTFSDPITIQAPEGAGTIIAIGAITGLDNASITLKANQNITTSNITANPGITIISTNGTLDTNAGILDSSSTSNPGGAIALSALGDITTNNITSHSDTSAGGDITLNSQTGVVSSANLDASGNTRGGKITVIAKNQITAGQINSSAITGDGGNVTLDPIGDIQVDFVNAQGGTSGKGGTVDITTNQFFRALSSFTDQNGINASLSTAGRTGGGDIVIRHDGGARGIPFDVGNASTNGTTGAITTGLSNSILPLQSFPGSYTQGNIQLITQNPPPPPPPPPTPSPSPQPDTNSISKDIQGVTFATTGISTINKVARILLNTTSILREDIEQALAEGQIEKAIALLEQMRMQEFQNYFEGNLTADTTESASLEQTQAVLSSIAESTGKTPAVIYVFTQPDQLQLILVTPTDKPILKTVYETNHDALLKMVSKFRSEVTEPRKKTGYQAAAKQLYQWLVTPLESELQAKKIDTLVFSMDAGLRSLPLAALYDGKQFLVEKYSIGLIPSINLTDTRYGDVKATEILAMGASKFTEQDPLPAVPVELSTIVGKQNVATENQELLPANESRILSKGFWLGESFLNQGFTLNNLKAQRNGTPFGVIHLATHGEFNLGAPRNSYIQLWDTKLQLDQLRQMGWNNPPVELLVLSACRTALGNEDAEFGFGGLAVAAGVKSALASLWYVSDEGTLALITEFYQRLKTAPIKAEALREAQIAMIKGQVRIEGGELRGIEQGEGSIPLPSELANIGDKDLSHPYYWSAFTMIGSPW